MSKKINSFLFLDFETGGFKSDKNPACEIGLLGIEGVRLEEQIRYDSVIQPYDDKLLYEKGAMDIHGLTREVCTKEGQSLKQVMEDFAIVAKETNVYDSKIARPILVGHNITFDIPFLIDIARRTKTNLADLISGYEDPVTGVFMPHYLDTMHYAKQADGHRDEKTVKFSLTEVSQRCGVDLVNAHRALNDVIASVGVFRSYVTKLRSSGGTTVASDGSGTVRKKFKI